MRLAEFAVSSEVFSVGVGSPKIARICWICVAIRDTSAKRPLGGNQPRESFLAA